MRRPLITEFMGDGFTINKAHKQYLENLELWHYIQALDAYCDELETSDSGQNIPDAIKAEGDSVCLLNRDWRRCDTHNGSHEGCGNCKHFKQNDY